MAPGTLSWRADKNPLYVTGFAAYQGMFEIQRKSRVVMIEIGANLKRSGVTCIESTQHQQSRQNQAKG
jgi:hypothetical protein